MSVTASTLLVLALLGAGCASAPTFDRYGGGTDAERANALMVCKERTNEAFKHRFAMGAIPVARMQREMTERTDLCMRGQGLQVKNSAAACATLPTGTT